MELFPKVDNFTVSDTQQCSLPQSTGKPPSDHHLSTGTERGQMDRHTENPGPDHQLDVLQLMPERWDGYQLRVPRGEICEARKLSLGC